MEIVAICVFNHHSVQESVIANSLTVEVRPFCRSLMYVRNNSGPSTDPCGTPEVTGEEVDVAPSQMTVWILLVRKESIQDKRFPWIPYLTHLLKNLHFSVIQL